MELFLDFLGYERTLEDQAKVFLTKARQNAQWAEAELMKFIIFQRERVELGEMSSTIRNYIKSTKLFCQMNDLVLNWDKVRRGLIHAMQSANDGAPKIDDNNTLISSGISIGAWDYLRWKRVAPISEGGDLITAKLLVYAGDPEKYQSFITPSYSTHN